MHLLRELVLTLVVALMAGFVLPWPVAADPATRFLGALVMVLPFQAGYGVASLAGKRAAPWLHALLAVAVWAMTLPGLLTQPVPGLAAGSALGWVALGLSAACALLAAALVPTGRARAGAAALWLFAAAFPGARAILVALVPAAMTEAAAAVLSGIGGAYVSLRLLLAIIYPLHVDPWFRRA